MKADAIDEGRKREEMELRVVVSAADDVISAIDSKELACVLAIKCPEDTPQAKKQKADMEEKKAALLDALHRALIELEELQAGVEICKDATLSRDGAPHALVSLKG
jgi:hypothetical protein